MNGPLVSVIIPAYNHENFIEQTLISIVNQDYRNIELILLNDGSVDNTDRKIKNMDTMLKNRFVRYIYISKENEGICKTLNKGLNLANGNYIIPFPSDDIMFPQRIKKQVEYMERNKEYKIVYTDGYLVWSNGIINVNMRYPDEYKFSRSLKFIEGDVFKFILSNVFLMPTPTICVAKECYDNVGCYDEELLCEDPDMFIRLAKVYKFGCIREPLIIHRIHNHNTGMNASYVQHMALRMKEKYRNSPLLNEEEKIQLFKTLRAFVGI